VAWMAPALPAASQEPSTEKHPWRTTGADGDEADAEPLKRREQRLGGTPPLQRGLALDYVL